MNVTVQIPTKPSYYGNNVTPEQVPMIVDRLESMIQDEFGHRNDITFERTGTPDGSCVQCPDAPDIAADIRSWIETNWTRAL